MAENFEIDPNLSPQAMLDGLYEWSISEFGVPICFNVFDKRIVRDYESLKDELSRDPEWEGDEDDIKRYIDAHLLPSLLQNDSPGFPLYAASRITFLKQLEKKWAYNIKKLKYISDHEEMLIDDVYTAEELDYSDLPTLDFYIAFLKERLASDKENLNHCSTPNDEEFCLVGIKKSEDGINYLEGKKFEELPSNLQKAIEKQVFIIKWGYEYSRLEGINEYHARILCGFSPNASLTRYAAHPIDTPLPDRFNINSSKYPYSYEDKEHLKKIYLYGDWTFFDSSTHVDFFSTPDFLIERAENKIILEIRNPANVDSKYMRRIGKIYVQYRQKLNLPKVGWGEKKGTKEMIRRRDKRLRDIYWQLRREKPMAAAPLHIKSAVEKIASEFKELISMETAKRIIYSKENITNSSAVNK